MGKHLLDKAIEHYEAAIATKQFFLEAFKAYTKLGVSYMEKDRVRDAIVLYKESIRLDPDYRDAHYNYGNALFKMKMLGEAIEQYNAAIECKLPDVHVAYFALGITFRTMGQLEKASDAYNEAMRLKPDYAEAYTNRGNCFANQGEPYMAEADYRESIRLKKDDTWKRSGLPAADFAAMVGVTRHTLYAWKRKFDEQGPGGLIDRPRAGP
jgi:tetratricopeptide (TPR) repeat protein